MRSDYKKPVAATVVEYSLIGGLVAAALLVAVTTVGTNLGGVFGHAHGQVSFTTQAP